MQSAGVEIGLVARAPRRSGVADLGSRHSFPRRDGETRAVVRGARARVRRAVRRSDPLGVGVQGLGLQDLRHLLVLRAAQARPRARSEARAQAPRTFRGGRRRGRHRDGGAFEPERGRGRSASVADRHALRGRGGDPRASRRRRAPAVRGAGRAGARAGCRTARVRRGDARRGDGDDHVHASREAKGRITRVITTCHHALGDARPDARRARRERPRDGGVQRRGPIRFRARANQRPGAERDVEGNLQRPHGHAPARPDGRGVGPLLPRGRRARVRDPRARREPQSPGHERENRARGWWRRRRRRRSCFSRRDERRRRETRERGCEILGAVPFVQPGRVRVRARLAVRTVRLDSGHARAIKARATDVFFFEGRDVIRRRRLLGRVRAQPHGDVRGRPAGRFRRFRRFRRRAHAVDVRVRRRGLFLPARPEPVGGGVAVRVADGRLGYAPRVLAGLPPVPLELPRRGGRRAGGRHLRRAGHPVRRAVAGHRAHRRQAVHDVGLCPLPDAREDDRRRRQPRAQDGHHRGPAREEGFFVRNARGGGT